MAAAACAALLLLAGANVPVLAAAQAGPLVTGRILLPTGGAAAGVRVTLVRQVGVGDALFGLLASALTLGIACVTQSVQLCQKASINGTTAADGNYRFAVGPGDLTNTLFGAQRTFSLGVVLPPLQGEVSGPAASATFKVGIANRRLPDLRLWRPALSLGGGGLQPRPHWDPLPAGYLSGPAYDVVFTTVAHEVIWDFPQAASDVPVEGRLLEDATGAMEVLAQGSGPDATFAYQSQSIAFAGAAGAPLSRGKACSLVDSSGNRLPLAPCGYTDGDLVTPAPVPAGTAFQTCPPSPGPSPTPSPSHPAVPTASTAPSCSPKTLEVDLAGDHYISLVVLRGCPGCRVQGARGSDWRDLGTTVSGGALELPPSTQASAIRVIPPGPTVLAGMREVSVWAGSAPAPAAGGILGQGGAGDAVGAALRAAGKKGIIGVGILALVACSGIAYLLGRRGRQTAGAMRFPNSPVIPVEPARPIAAAVPPEAVKPAGRRRGRAASAAPGSGLPRAAPVKGRKRPPAEPPKPPGPKPS